MMKALICTTVAALSLAATANVAAASSRDPDKAQDNVMSASQPAPATATEKKYCVKEALTGSRVARTVCKTESQWKAEGFDPLNP